MIPEGWIVDIDYGTHQRLVREADGAVRTWYPDQVGDQVDLPTRCCADLPP